MDERRLRTVIYLAGPAALLLAAGIAWLLGA